MSKSLTQMTKAELILHAQELAKTMYDADVLATQVRTDLFFAKKKLVKLYDERAARFAQPSYRERVKAWCTLHPHVRVRMTNDGAMHDGEIVVAR